MSGRCRSCWLGNGCESIAWHGARLNVILRETAVTWSPTRAIAMLAPPMNYSTCPVRVRVDAVEEGHPVAVLKPDYWQSASSDLLRREWLGWETAKWLGLDVPSIARVELDEVVSVRLAREGQGPPGRWGLAVQYAQPITWDYSFPKVLNKVRNPAMFTQLPIFDTWVKNGDRCMWAHGPTVADTLANWQHRIGLNKGNTLLVQGVDGIYVWAIDHGMAFRQMSFDGVNTRPEWPTQVVCYGLQHSFVGKWNQSIEAATLQKIDGFTSSIAKELAGRVPAPWALTAEEVNHWSELMVQRAQWMVRSFSEMVRPYIAQPPTLWEVIK